MKINLEKELIKQNARISTPAELLLIKEHEKVGVLSHDLSRIGFTHLEEGKRIKSKIYKLKQETLRFDQSRVFHISQIQEVAEKYYLRFLPTHYYKGSVDPELPFKIGNFEAAYGVKMRSGKETWDGGFNRNYYHTTGNSYILAPKESFQLEEKPKDPLLFYMINEEYFYLVHKWGNDLSVTRRLKGLFTSSLATWIATYLLSFSITYLLFMNSESFGIAMFLVAIFHNVPYLAALMPDFERDRTGEAKGLRFFKPNNWNSPFKD